MLKTNVSDSDNAPTNQTGSGWLEHARGVPARLIKIMTRLPVHFLDTQCSQYINSPTPTPAFLEPTREKVDLLLRSVRRCEHVILNEFGCGDEMKEVSKVERTVLLMLNWIDDILLAIMDPSIELERERRCGRLAYQTHGHYVLTP